LLVKQLMTDHEDSKNEILSLMHRTLFENASDGIVILAPPHLQVIDANRNAAESTGYAKEELLQKEFVDLFESERIEDARKYLKEVVERGEGRTDNLSLSRKDAGPLDVEVSTKRIDLGSRFFYQANFHDLTDQRKLGKKIQESKKSLESIYDSIQDQLSLQNLNFEILRVNKPVIAAYQCTFKDLIGKKCFEVYYRRSSPCERCPVAATIKTKQPACTIIQIPDRNTSLRISSYPVFNEKGTLISVIEYTQDITEEQRLQKQRFQAEKLAGIDILASGAAHEINNPLSAIIGMAEIAMEEQSLSEIKNYLRDILVCSERITAIVKGLRTYSCLAQKEKLRLIDLNEVLEKSLKTVPSGVKSLVEVSKDFHPSVTMEADEVEIQLVFGNLITNAFEAMDGKRGRLLLSTQALKNSVEVKICDDGVGIPQQHVNQIFDPFFTTKKHGEGEGTGLGLNIVYRIVTKYEGTIDVESKEGMGTTFNISFPKGSRFHE